jgi:hypothetical protein
MEINLAVNCSLRMRSFPAYIFHLLGIPTCKGPLFLYYSNESRTIIIPLLNLELIYGILAFTRGIFKLLYILSRRSGDEAAMVIFFLF